LKAKAEVRLLNTLEFEFPVPADTPAIETGGG
jgi:hypothetical protein